MIKMAVTTTDSGDWLICDGRLLNASEFPELFQLMGQRYGGSGDQFALPDLRGDKAQYLVKSKSGPADSNYQGTVSQMVLWVGNAIPAGWLPCDGRLVQAPEYPILSKVAAASQPMATPAYHLPMVPPLAGVPYIICVEGIDPMPDGSAAGSDDDY